MLHHANVVLTCLNHNAIVIAGTTSLGDAGSRIVTKLAIKGVLALIDTEYGIEVSVDWRGSVVLRLPSLAVGLAIIPCQADGVSVIGSLIKSNTATGGKLTFGEVLLENEGSKDRFTYSYPRVRYNQNAVTDAPRYKTPYTRGSSSLR